MYFQSEFNDATEKIIGNNPATNMHYQSDSWKNDSRVNLTAYVS